MADECDSGALNALADICSYTGGQGPEGAGLPGHPGQGPPGRQDGRRDVLLRAGGADAAFSLRKLNSHERCKAVDTDAHGLFARRCACPNGPACTRVPVDATASHAVVRHAGG